MSPSTTSLYRPVGQKELDLIRETKWLRFPPRLFWQPIFYPVLTLEYAQHIARDWNTKDQASDFVGYVLQFEVLTAFIQRYEVHEVGGRDRREYWIPAEDLGEFNEAIVGPIQLVEEFRP
ncbi:hypothetical protein NG895_01080 [Aeoliella sp. ICT_H6.2]|uniref:ADP-ribosylation/crystallin J1 n=1 Tax=Aeoliella straminimaris TaxID=2954799 RepID=A0A9X2F665_9BACT|nr:hypothetical protein [Aeoliella straminimaris]MCO6042489.1 hypothetical protein [Aeoliella straminimaris]